MPLMSPSNWSRILASLPTTLGAFVPGASSKEAWEREYANGRWDMLRSTDESARHAIILGHLIRRTGKADVLDIGCGPGRLLEFVSHVAFEHYTGLDLSEEAIRRAQELGIPNTSFEVATAEAFVPQRSLDLIVFNEVVFYLTDPLAVLQRYQQFLRPGGMLIVSMVDVLLARLLWRKLARGFVTVESTAVSNARGHRWVVRALEPRKMDALAIR